MGATQNHPTLNTLTKNKKLISDISTKKRAKNVLVFF